MTVPSGSAQPVRALRTVPLPAYCDAERLVTEAVLAHFAALGSMGHEPAGPSRGRFTVAAAEAEDWSSAAAQKILSELQTPGTHMGGSHAEQDLVDLQDRLLLLLDASLSPQPKATQAWMRHWHQLPPSIRDEVLGAIRNAVFSSDRSLSGEQIAQLIQADPSIVSRVVDAQKTPILMRLLQQLSKLRQELRKHPERAAHLRVQLPTRQFKQLEQSPISPEQWESSQSEVLHALSQQLEQLNLKHPALAALVGHAPGLLGDLVRLGLQMTSALRTQLAKQLDRMSPPEQTKLIKVIAGAEPRWALEQVLDRAFTGRKFEAFVEALRQMPLHQLAPAIQHCEIESFYGDPDQFQKIEQLVRAAQTPAERLLWLAVMADLCALEGDSEPLDRLLLQPEAFQEVLEIASSLPPDSSASILSVLFAGKLLQPNPAGAGTILRALLASHPNVVLALAREKNLVLTQAMNRMGISLDSLKSSEQLQRLVDEVEASASAHAPAARPATQASKRSLQIPLPTRLNAEETATALKKIFEENAAPFEGDRSAAGDWLLRLADKDFDDLFRRLVTEDPALRQAFARDPLPWQLERQVPILLNWPECSAWLPLSVIQRMKSQPELLDLVRLWARDPERGPAVLNFLAVEAPSVPQFAGEEQERNRALGAFLREVLRDAPDPVAYMKKLLATAASAAAIKSDVETVIQEVFGGNWSRIPLAAFLPLDMNALSFLVTRVLESGDAANHLATLDQLVLLAGLQAMPANQQPATKADLDRIVQDLFEKIRNDESIATQIAHLAKSLPAEAREALSDLLLRDIEAFGRVVLCSTQSDLFDEAIARFMLQQNPEMSDRQAQLIRFLLQNASPFETRVGRRTPSPLAGINLETCRQLLQRLSAEARARVAVEIREGTLSQDGALSLLTLPDLDPQLRAAVLGVLTLPAPLASDFYDGRRVADLWRAAALRLLARDDAAAQAAMGVILRQHDVRLRPAALGKVIDEWRKPLERAVDSSLGELLPSAGLSARAAAQEILMETADCSLDESGSDLAAVRESKVLLWMERAGLVRAMEQAAKQKWLQGNPPENYLVALRKRLHTETGIDTETLTREQILQDPRLVGSEQMREELRKCGLQPSLVAQRLAGELKQAQQWVADFRNPAALPKLFPLIVSATAPLDWRNLESLPVMRRVAEPALSALLKFLQMSWADYGPPAQRQEILLPQGEGLDMLAMALGEFFARFGQQTGASAEQVRKLEELIRGVFSYAAKRPELTLDLLGILRTKTVNRDGFLDLWSFPCSAPLFPAWLAALGLFTPGHAGVEALGTLFEAFDRAFRQDLKRDPRLGQSLTELLLQMHRLAKSRPDLAPQLQQVLERLFALSKAPTSQDLLRFRENLRILSAILRSGENPGPLLERALGVGAVEAGDRSEEFARGLRSIVFSLMPGIQWDNAKQQTYLEMQKCMRQPFADLRFRAKMREHQESIYLEELDRILEAEMEGRFKEQLYEAQDNPQIQYIQDRFPDLFKAWREGPAPQEVAVEGSPGSPLRSMQVIATDDFEDRLLAGTEVPASCQSLDGHSAYNRGVFGFLEGPDRLFVIKDQERGPIVGRCVVRLLLDARTQQPALVVEPYYGEDSEGLKKELLARVVEFAAQLNLPLLMTEGIATRWPCRELGLLIEPWLGDVGSVGTRAPATYVDSNGRGIAERGPWSIGPYLRQLKRYRAKDAEYAENGEPDF